MRTDEELMTAYSQGELCAFQELYQRHSKRVYGFLLKRSSSRQMADEVFQTTFLKLHEVRHQYSQDKLFLPWLFVMARTTWIDRLRKDKAEKRKTDAVGNEYVANAFENEEINMEQMNDILSTLPRDQRELITMRYVEDLSFEEISKAKNMKETAVRQSISRVTRKLKELFKGN